MSAFSSVKFSLKLLCLDEWLGDTGNWIENSQNVVPRETSLPFNFISPFSMGKFPAGGNLMEKLRHLTYLQISSICSSKGDWMKDQTRVDVEKNIYAPMEKLAPRRYSMIFYCIWKVCLQSNVKRRVLNVDAKLKIWFLNSQLTNQLHFIKIEKNQIFFFFSFNQLG